MSCHSSPSPATALAFGTTAHADSSRPTYTPQGVRRTICCFNNHWFETQTLGTGAQIPTGYIVKTLRAQSTCDSNVPSNQMLSTFWICPAMWPQYAQWVHAEYIFNVPSHVTPMYPVGKQSGTFWMFGKMQSQCAQWVTWWIYSKYVFQKCLNVPTSQELISFTMDLVMWL